LKCHNVVDLLFLRLILFNTSEVETPPDDLPLSRVTQSHQHSRGQGLTFRALTSSLILLFFLHFPVPFYDPRYYFGSIVNYVLYGRGHDVDNTRSNGPVT